MPNIYDPEFDELRDAPGFEARRARMGYQLETRRLGVSLWEIPPGQAAYPYHAHLAEEELLVLLDGALDVRTPDGWRRAEQGEVLSFPVGEEGAHQVVNRGDQPVRFLALSTNGEPDIVLYPDSGKLGAAERRPTGGGVRAFFRLDDAVDYWEGERAPES